MSSHLTNQPKIPVYKQFSRETMPTNNTEFSQYQPTYYYTGHTQKNGVVSKVDNEFISRPTRAQHTLSAAATVQVCHVLPAVRFSCLLRCRRASFQDGVAAGEGFLCAPF
jgi:hypothetical protein